MSFLDLVWKRQSTRAYISRKVDREKIDRCIEAARLAPSACNSQPWSFIVVDDPQTKAQLDTAAFSGVYGAVSAAKQAPVMIVVVTEHANYTARLGGFFRKIQYSLIDIGIACEHLVLQAAEEGLGTCWIGWFNEKKLKKVLNLPRSTKVDVLITIGYAADNTVREKTRKTLDEIRRYV
jgi:nitroreductase